MSSEIRRHTIYEFSKDLIIGWQQMQNFVRLFNSNLIFWVINPTISKSDTNLEQQLRTKVYSNLEQLMVTS